MKNPKHETSIREKKDDFGFISTHVKNRNFRKNQSKSDTITYENYHSMLQNTRDTLYLFDLKRKKYIYVSPSVKGITGIPSDKFLTKAFGLLKKNVYKKDQYLVQKHMEHLFNNKGKGTKDFYIEFRMEFRKGDIIWIADSEKVTYDLQGNPDKLYGNLRNITFTKVAQEQLQSSYELEKGYLRLLSSIQDAIPAEIALLDKESNIMTVNEAWKRFSRENAFAGFGYQIGVNYIKLCDKAKGQFSKEAVRVARGIEKVLRLELKNYECEYPCHSPDEVRWFRLVVGPINSKRNEGAVLMHIDITELKLAQIKLKNSEEQYRILFEESPLPTCVIDTKTLHFIAVNDAAIKKYGYTKDEFYKLSLIDIRPAEDLPNFKKSWNKDVNQEIQASNIGTFRHKKKNGTIIYVSVTVKSIIYNGKESRLVIFDDVTEKIKIEEELARRNHEMNLLYESEKELTSTLDVDIIYNKIFKIVSEMIPCDLMLIISYEKKENIIRCTNGWLKGKKIDVNKFPLLKNNIKSIDLHSEIIKYKRPIIINDHDLKANKIKFVSSLIKSGDISSRKTAKPLCLFGMIVPMNLEGEVIGSIEIIKFNKHPYHKDQMKLLEALAAQLTAANLNATLYRKAQIEISEREKAELLLKDKSDEITLLYETGKEISSSLETMVIYDKIHKIVSKIMPCDSMLMSSFDLETKMIHCKHAWLENKKLDASKFPPLPLDITGNSIQSHAILTGNSSIIDDYDNKLKQNKYSYNINKNSVALKRRYKKDKVAESAIVIPIKFDGDVLGILQVRSYKKKAYDENHLRILQGISGQLSAATGKALLYQKAKNEIQQRIFTEEKLLTIRENLENAQKISHLGSYEANLISRKVSWSDEMYRICGITQDLKNELEFEFTMEIFAPEDRDKALEEYNKVFNSEGIHSFESRIRRPNGEMRNVQIENQAVRDIQGNVIAVIGTMLDITERKKADEKLRSSEIHLIASQQIAKVGSWEIDISNQNNINNNPLIWSDETCRIFGFEPGKVVVSNELFFSMIHPEDVTMVRTAVKEAIESKTHYNIEHRIVLNNGEIKYVNEKSDIIFDKDTGKLLKMIGTVQDITEQKIVNDKIVIALHEKELMLKEIHHRVKNNLQVVSSLLRIQAASIDDKRVSEYLRISEQRVKSMALIHQQLYKKEDLSRIDFNEYVKRLSEFLFSSYGIESDRIKLTINIKEIYFGIDTAIPCGLIINELITNSLKHAFPGNKKGEINISITAEENGMNRFILEDNGKGIEKGFDIEKCQTLGMQLVSTLSKQLESDIKIINGHGTHIEMLFRDSAYKKRIL